MEQIAATRPDCGSAGTGRIALAGFRNLALDGRMLARNEADARPDGAQLVAWMTAVAGSRDRAAFAGLFAYFAPRLKSYVMRLGADNAMAEEVVQEAMLMVWRKAESFDARQAGVSTWVFTIARNKRIDKLRRERRPELDPNDPALVPAPAADPVDVVAADQDGTRLRAAIETLPEEQSNLLRMSYFEDKSHREIADELDIPLGTVKSRLRLALAKLRAQLQDEDHA